MNTEQRERARRQGGELIQAAMAALDAAEQKLAAAERNTTYALGCQAESLAAFNAAEARCRELGQWGNALHEQWTKAESELARVRELEKEAKVVHEANDDLVARHLTTNAHLATATKLIREGVEAKSWNTAWVSKGRAFLANQPAAQQVRSYRLECGCTSTREHGQGRCAQPAAPTSAESELAQLRSELEALENRHEIERGSRKRAESELAHLRARVAKITSEDEETNRLLGVVMQQRDTAEARVLKARYELACATQFAECPAYVTRALEALRGTK